MIADYKLSHTRENRPVPVSYNVTYGFITIIKLTEKVKYTRYHSYDLETFD